MSRFFYLLGIFVILITSFIAYNPFAYIRRHDVDLDEVYYCSLGVEGMGFYGCLDTSQTYVYGSFYAHKINKKEDTQFGHLRGKYYYDLLVEIDSVITPTSKDSILDWAKKKSYMIDNSSYNGYRKNLFLKITKTKGVESKTIKLR